MFGIFVRAMTISICIESAVLSTPAHADPHPKGLAKHAFETPSKPETVDGITSFRIFDRGCSTTDYGDGRGENDCKNGNVRSVLVGRPDVAIGRRAVYSFDMRISSGLTYEGWYNDHAIGFLPDARDSRLRIASWEGNRLHNFVYMLKADSRNGITFLGAKCQEPKDFGAWFSFSMDVRWTLKENGRIVVKCGDKVVYKKEGIATAVAPHCYITNQCEPGKSKNPSRITFILGPTMAGFGHEWKKYGLKSQFTEIQKDGIEVQVRNFRMKAE